MKVKERKKEVRFTVQDWSRALLSVELDLKKIYNRAMYAELDSEHEAQVLEMAGQYLDMYWRLLNAKDVWEDE